MWKGKFWGKLMISACRVAEHTKDARLKDYLHAEGLRLIAFQRPDGYLGTYTRPDFVVPEQDLDAVETLAARADDGALCLALYHDADLTLGDDRVTLSGNYPVGRVVTVKLAKKTAGTVRFRVPTGVERSIERQRTTVNLVRAWIARQRLGQRN